jgi:hypothetical protein
VGRARGKLGHSHFHDRNRVRVLVVRIEWRGNFLSWRDIKTRKLGGCCARTTPHEPEAPTIHANAGKVVKWPPLEVIHVLSTISHEHQV